MKRSTLLVAALAALYLTCGAKRDFWYPDEPDLAEITRQMVRSGDWLRLRLHGEVFADYPPLFFWLASAAAHVGGLHEPVMRLPTLLSALGLLICTGMWARRRMGRDAAFWSMAILGTTYFFVWQAVNFHLDMVFALLFGAAIFAYDLSRDSSNRGKRIGLTIAAGGFMGLASLTKGPAGIVLPCGVLAVDHLLRREWRGIGKLTLVGIGGTAVFLGWSAAYAAAAGEGNILYFIYVQNVERFLTGWSHEQPWYYYLRNIWADAMPWSLFLLFAVPAAWRRAREGSRSLALALTWFAVGFIFFTLSRSKRHVYILPLYPAMALMIGHLLESAVRQGAENRRWLWRVGLVPVTLALLVGGVGVVVALPKLQERLPGAEAITLPVVVLGLVMVAGGVSLAVLLRRGHIRRLVRAVPLIFGLGYLVTMGWLFPVLDHPLSAKRDGRWLARHVRQAGGDALIFFAKDEGIPNEASALVFYSGLPMRLLRTAQDVAEHHRRDPDAILMVEDGHLDDLQERVALEPTVVKEIRIGSDEFLAVRLRPPRRKRRW